MEAGGDGCRSSLLLYLQHLLHHSDRHHLQASTLLRLVEQTVRQKQAQNGSNFYTEISFYSAEVTIECEYEVICVYRICHFHLIIRGIS